MRVAISNKCNGCGLCATLSPEVFDLYETFAVANQNNVCGNEETCIDAALSCPLNAIMISEW